MITTAAIDRTLMQLMLDAGAWEGSGIDIDQVLRAWQSTTLRQNDCAAALERTSQRGWIELRETVPGHITVSFTRSGFDLITQQPPDSTRVDRGLGSLMRKLGMSVGIQIDAPQRTTKDRRRPAG